MRAEKTRVGENGLVELVLRGPVAQVSGLEVVVITGGDVDKGVSYEIPTRYAEAEDGGCGKALLGPGYEALNSGSLGKS